MGRLIGIWKLLGALVFGIYATLGPDMGIGAQCGYSVCKRLGHSLAQPAVSVRKQDTVVVQKRGSILCQRSWTLRRRPSGSPT